MIMKMCWNLEPTERPTFNKISQMIERILGDQDEQEKVSYCEIIPQIGNKTREAGHKIPHQQTGEHLWFVWLDSFFPENAQSDSQQLIYRNVQQEQVTEGCDELKCYDRPCDQSCDHEEEEEPLMKTNNYQFC